MTAYIWQAEQTEPGLDGRAYRATSTQTAPAAIEPVQHNDAIGDPTGLVHAESVFGEWRYLGTIDGTAFESARGESCVERDDGHRQAVEDIVAYELYKAA